MRKHLLSYYGETCNFENNTDILKLYGPTLLTENVENSDADEFLVQAPTKLTFTLENSDEDEFETDIEIFNNEEFDSFLI